MDLKDKKLIYMLDLNSRAKESDLARTLNTSKQVVNYRIKKLFTEGIIKNTQTILSLNSLKIEFYAQIYCKFNNCSSVKEQEILDYLVNHKHVAYVGLLGGKFDFSIAIVAKTIHQFELYLKDILKKYSKELRDYTVSLRIEGTRFPKKYLVDMKPSHQTKSLLASSQINNTLDELDIDILKRLANDSRKSLLEISEGLKTPFSTVRARVRTLENKKIISGYSMLLNLEKLNIQAYKLFIKVNDKSEETSKQLFDFALEHPNIVWFLKTLGDHDYELRIDVQNQAEYQDILKKIRANFSSSIQEMETLIVFKELKEDFGVALNVL